MTLEDPFYVVKDEVCKAINKTRGLYQRWSELQEDGEHSLSDGGIAVGKDDLDWTNTELRNSLRSIEWDLEDLEETIGIVEKNPKKFRIKNPELSARIKFIEDTQKEVKLMNTTINQSKKYRAVKQAGIESSLKMPVATPSSGKYSRLVNEFDSPSKNFVNQTLQQQSAIIQQQDENLDNLSVSMGNLKNMSQQIGIEIEEQEEMLDDFGHEMEHTQSKMETTVNKMARIMRLTNDQRQWAAIGTLSGILIVVIILFFVL